MRKQFPRGDRKILRDSTNRVKEEQTIEEDK
jgi:hypothetical protein